MRQLLTNPTLFMNESLLLNHLGSRIRELRTSKKMTQNEIAMRCDFEKASMSRIESGKTNMTLRSLYKICKALDVPIVDLFED
jgi:transcriptional regulator with XRE-family HTH domain